MDKKEVIEIRHYLGKTQNQMAGLLGVSLKSIKSFEQGWRNIPVSVERQMLFLLATIKSQNKTKKKMTCWEIKKCPIDMRRNCPAWEFQVGHLCWFINGTICHGEVQESWQEKMKMCKQCEAFQSLIPNLKK